MSQKIKKMRQLEIKSDLKKIPDWNQKMGGLVRVVDFPTFTEGLKFVYRLGLLAERMDHHPKIVLDYKKVTVIYSTHSVKGLTALDFEAARGVEKLLRHSI